MKLTMIFLLATCITVSARTGAQTVTLNKKEASLKSVLKEVEAQTGYQFFFAVSLEQKFKPVTAQFNSLPLMQALEKIFTNQDIAYKVFDKTIALREKDEKDETTYTPPPPPPIDVKGRVVDENGKPVIATVQVKGTNKITATNDSGYFEIKSIDENSILVIRAVNIDTREVRVNGRTDLSSIAVLSKVSETEGVTVNTGYQTLKANEVIGSTVIIGKAQLDQRLAVNIIEKLEGIAPGLVFNKKPTDGTNEIRIRGESTLFGVTQPLIFVDNFRYDGDINDINPNDVESITILKDAAAASMSGGAQSGNGVIVITTKKGKLNQPLRVQLNLNTTIGGKPDLEYFPQISSSSFIDFETMLFSKGFYNSDLTNTNMPPLSPVVEILDQRRRGLISASDSMSLINNLRRQDWRQDFLKHIYRRSIAQQYQINVSGGANQVSYYFSAGLDRGFANIVGNESNRITLNTTTTYKPHKKLDLQFGLGYSENTNLNNGVSEISNFYPYMRLVDDNGIQLSVPMHRAIWEDTIANHGFLDWKYYPLKEREYTDRKTKSYTTRLSTALKYSLSPGLSFNFSYQYLRTATSLRTLQMQDAYTIRNNINRFAILNNGNFIGSNYPLGGTLTLNKADLVSHNGRVDINYKRKWNQHLVTGIIGFDIRENRSESSGLTFLGYDDATGTFATPNTFTSYPTYPSGNSTLTGTNAFSLNYSGKLYRFRSFFGNVSYLFRERYNLYASARMDQANIFGVKTNDKGTPLWALGSKWSIGKEPFFNKRIFSDLVLRVSYGYNGNLASEDLSAIVTSQYAGTASYTGLPYAVINNFPNPKLKWETTAHLNLGVDFSLKNDILKGTIEYFQKEGRDLIGTTLMDPTTGIRTLKGNFSDMRTKGIDLMLQSVNINKGLSWSSTLIFNYASEIVTRYDEPASDLKNVYSGSVRPIAGYPIRGVFSYQWGGLDPLTGDPMIYLSDTLNKSYTSATLNSISFGDYVYSGRYNPPFSGSILNTLKWKGFAVNINIVYKLGHVFRRNSIDYNVLFQKDGWRNTHADFDMRWQKPGDEMFTNVPSLTYPNNTVRNTFYTSSDLLIERADHIRLQYLNLEYNFRHNLLKKGSIKDLRIYCYVNNLGILWRANKRDIDPDYPYLSSPPQRTYSFGLTASF